MTSFRNKLSVVAMLLVGMGCTNENTPYTIDHFFPIVTNGSTPCAWPNDIETSLVSNGTIDVAAGSPQFFVGARIRDLYDRNIPAVELRTGEVQEGEARNRPVFTSMRVTYRPSKRLGTTPKAYTVNHFLPLDEAKGQVDMMVHLISPEFGTQLFENLTPSNTFDDFVDVMVDVQFFGELGNSKTPIRTGIASFPLRAFRSAPTTTCAAGDVYRRFLKVDPGDPNSAINVCSYVGQGYQSEILAAPPATCCTPGTVGC